MMWAVLVLTALVAGCREGPQPRLPDSPPADIRVWCADRFYPDWIRCFDLLVPSLSWPDKALICFDDYQTCARLGQYRMWLRLFADARPAEARR